MGLYESLENAYYGLMDKLSFLRVYDWFVNPIESRGIPSFPIFVLLLAVIAGVALFYLGVFNAAPQEIFTVNVLDADGQPLDGASVKIVADGQSFYAKTNANGVAEFKGLPDGKAATATAQSTGFASASKEFNTADKTLTLQFSGAAIPSPEQKIVVTVTSLLGSELGGVTLTYADPSTGETKRLETDATGRAEIFFENEDDFFNVRASLDGFKGEYKTCFASSGYCELELTSDQQFETDGEGQQIGGDIEEKGSVRVDVRNEDGESVAARVTLYDADSVTPLSEGFSDVSGPAFFDSVAALGTSVYVVVEPDDAEAYASYNGGYENDLRTVASQTLFDVVLQPSGVVPTTRSDFKIVDGSNSNEEIPVSGALVSLYSLANPLRSVASVLTDENGEASFEIAEGAQVYAIASADGFLPYLDRSVETGSAKTIALMPLVAGNNAVVRALVVDDEATPQQLARVFMVTGDGFYSGLPVQETGADGWTEFAGVPIDGEYGFRATLGSRSGKSDLFIPAIEEEMNATVTLDSEVGFLRVNAEDAAGGNAVAARFDAVLVDSKEVYDYCSSKAQDNYSCDLTIKAGKQFFVRAAADNYAPAESEEIVLAAEERAEKKLLVVSLNASRELKILSFELQPTGASALPGDAKQLDNGRVYRALLTVNFPGGANANGAFLRVGDKQSASDEAAAITYFDSGDSNDNVSVLWSSAWNDGDDCVSDLASQESGGAKWVNWEYASASDAGASGSSSSVFGVRTIAAKVFVKPGARSKDRIVVYYRAYSRKKDVFYRSPLDGELGFNEKTAEKDWCRAATQSRSYSVVEGESSCTNDACITVSFDSEDNDAVDDPSQDGDGFKVKTNSRFNARVSIRSFTGAAGGALRVAVDDALSLQSQESADGSSAQIALRYDENGETALTLPVKARLPSQQALLKFSLVEGNGGDSVASAQRFVVVEGLAKMLLTFSPANLSVQTPSTFTVIVKRADDGSPIEDARVSLRETDEGGFVFGGSPNGDYAIAGDASEGRGLDGRYVFKRLNAALPGSFNVVVERKGFSSVRASVDVTAAEFLEFSRDLNDVRLGCDPVSLEVSSALGLDVPVLASFNGVQCAALRGSGVTQKDSNTWSFLVRKNKNAKIELEPLRNGKCYLVFNSVLPSNGGSSSETAWLNVNCSKFDVSPTPTPANASNCTSENCVACTESECSSEALNDSCEAKYARNPQGANVFVKCLQREKPAQACDAAYCSLCSETECNALFAAKNCTPLYTAPKNAYEAPVFVNCTSYQAIDCSPAKFNFQNILARRLAQYHARALLDPQVKKTSVGASAKTQIVYDMAGLRVARTADNCEATGALRVTCTKKINAIVPTNAMAFSIYNQFGGVGADFKAQLSSGNEKCFQLKRGDEPSVFDKLASLPGDVGAALGVVPPQAANTWKIFFLPKDGCVEYYWSADGKLFAKPVDGAESLTLKISPIQNVDYSVELTMVVEANEDEEIAKYAFLFTPYTMQAGSADANVDAGFFVNNMQAGQKLVLTGREAQQSSENELVAKPIYSLGEANGELVLPSQSVGVTRVYYDLPDGATQPVVGINAKAGVREFTDVAGGVNLNPLAYADDAALQCSDGKCCNEAEYKAAQAQLRIEANNVFKLILADVEEYYDGNIVDGNAALFKRAVDDSLADYMGQQGAYLICKNLGMDPLAKIKNACAEKANSIDYLGSSYGTDLQTEGFGEIYQDSFTETACDSSLLNYAFGFGDAMAPGGTFTDVFANRLTGALQPRSGTYYKRNYVVPVDIHLNVVLKRGDKVTGVGAGVEVYSIRPKDVESSDSAAGSGEWISLEKPKAWTGLGAIQEVISRSTEGVGFLTGCLSPYLGGTPDKQKPSTERCQLGGNTVTQKLAYCVEGEPNVEKAPSSGEWQVYDDAATCWKDGVSAVDGKTCLNTLKTVASVAGGIGLNTVDSKLMENLGTSVTTGAVTDVLTSLFSSTTSKDKFGYLNETQYNSFLTQRIEGVTDVASMPLCFRTWAYSETDKKYLNPADTEIARLLNAGTLKQKWVCTPLWKLDDHKSCVPLDDIFKPSTFQPTQCSSGKTNDFRCRGNDVMEYKCDLPGEEKK